MSKMNEENGATPLVLWVDHCPPSLNKTRYQHWTKARKHVQEAKEAWLCALRSSESARDSLIRIIYKLHSKDTGTVLQWRWPWQTTIQESNGSMVSVKPVDGEEQS